MSVISRNFYHFNVWLTQLNDGFQREQDTFGGTLMR